MASKNYAAQINLQSVFNLEQVTDGYVGLSSKADGVYYILPGFTESETRLLGVKDRRDNVRPLLATDSSLVTETGIRAAIEAGYTHTHPYLPLAGGIMSNTNLVEKLNADYLDGQHGSYFATADSLTLYLPLAGGTMANTNLVNKMNADLLDGQHGDYYSSATHTHAYLPLSGGTMSNTNIVNNLNAEYLGGKKIYTHISSLVDPNEIVPTSGIRALFGAAYVNTFHTADLRTALLYETSSDGTTWSNSTSSLTDDIIERVFMGNMYYNSPLTVEPGTYHRITLTDETSGMGRIDGLFINTSYKYVDILIERYTNGTPKTWVTVKSLLNVNMSGAIGLSGIHLTGAAGSEYSRKLRITLKGVSGIHYGINGLFPFQIPDSFYPYLYKVGADGQVIYDKLVVAKVFKSTVLNGIAPLIVASKTLVSNLNADYLDGQHGAHYLDYNNFTNKPTLYGGTITSVGMTVPTGLSVSPASISTSGTFAVTYANGYSIPTIDSQNDWDEAYLWGNHAVYGYIKAVENGLTKVGEKFRLGGDLIIAETIINSPEQDQHVTFKGANVRIINASGVDGHPPQLILGRSDASHQLPTAEIVLGVVGASGYAGGSLLTNTASISFEAREDMTPDSKGSSVSIFTTAIGENVTRRIARFDHDSNLYFMDSDGVIGNYETLGGNHEFGIYSTTGDNIIAAFNVISGHKAYYTYAHGKIVYDDDDDLLRLKSNVFVTGSISITGQLYSTITGVTPLIVASNVVVANLNADLLDGQHGAYYLAYANLTGVPTSFPPTVHNHNDLYYTKAQGDAKYSLIHTHPYEPAITAGSVGQYWSGDKTWQTLPSLTGLITYASLSAVSPISYDGAGKFSMITNAYAPYGTVSFPGFGTTHVLAAYGDHLHTGVYEPVISAGTIAQYWRGDKTWQTLTIPSIVGLITYASLSATSPISYDGVGKFSMITNAYAPYGTVSFPGFGTTVTTAAYGNHLHTGVYAPASTVSFPGFGVTHALAAYGDHLHTGVYAPASTVSFPGFGTTHALAAYGDHTHSNYLIGTKVDSFNTRTGVVTLIKADVEGVLTGAIASHTHEYVPLRTQANWNDATVVNNIVGMLAWKNYGNGHVIFDASEGLSPSGTSLDNSKNSTIAWTDTYPTLMGWNGSNTYGVRVDSARNADLLGGHPASDFTGTALHLKEYVVSRGENLISNGSAYLKTNENFEQFTFDGAEAYASNGSFRYTGTGNNFTSEKISVDPNNRYKLNFYAKTLAATGAYYAYINCFDADGYVIHASCHMYEPNTLTTLAQELKNGDTVVHLTSAANWINTGTAGVATHIRTLTFWNYTNSYGYTYPPETYSRYVYHNAWNPGAIDYNTNTITLLTPWSGGSISAGTKLSNGSSGGTYKYLAMAYTFIPTTWTNYSGVMNGTDYSGLNQGGMLPPGTATISIGWLMDYENVGETCWFANLSFAQETNFLRTSGGAMDNTALVSNLNADLLDGYHASELGGTHTHPYLPLAGGAMSNNNLVTALNADFLDGQHGAYYLAYANLTGVPTSFPPSAHTHDDRYYTETESDVKFAPIIHSHDDRYYTKTLSDGRYEPVITAGTTSQYWRGDKTWQALPSSNGTVSSVGLADTTTNNIFNITNTPINTNGNIGIAFQPKSQGLVLGTDYTDGMGTVVPKFIHLGMEHLPKLPFYDGFGLRLTTDQSYDYFIGGINAEAGAYGGVELIAGTNTTFGVALSGGVVRLTLNSTGGSTGVTSFNGRTGAVALSKADIEDKLTGAITSHTHAAYVPIAGGVTLTGSVVATPSLGSAPQIVNVIYGSDDVSTLNPGGFAAGTFYFKHA